MPPDYADFHPRQVHSFVRREGRLTKGQQHAMQWLWPRYGVNDLQELRNPQDLFPTPRPLVIDIGFGNGEALASMARDRPDLNFIGIEVYRPGVGSLLKQLEQQSSSNVRVVTEDAVGIIEDYLPPGSCAAFTIWFPDPWPKKRHHKRRLISGQFIESLSLALADDGLLHMATDWPDYANWIQKVMSVTTKFTTIESTEHALRLQRPQTKFERRGLREGHAAQDLVYQFTSSLE